MLDDGDADDAFGDRLAAQPEFLQPTPHAFIDWYPPVSIWQPKRRLLYVEFDSNQGATLVANFNIWHRSRWSLPRSVLTAGSQMAGPARIRQLIRSNSVDCPRGLR